MKVGLLNHGWWRPACDVLGLDVTSLPVAGASCGNPYAADLQARVDNSAAVLSALSDSSVDRLLDNGGTGLQFVSTDGSLDRLALLHETVGVSLASHFVDPMVTAFQRLPFDVMFQCLHSQSWLKAVWDMAQVLELRRFGVPGVVHMPMAAPERVYCTDPLDPTRSDPIVSFVGGQNTTYFSSGMGIASKTLLPGTLAQAIRADLRNLCFFDVYYDIYGLDEPVDPDEPLNVRSAKAAAYFAAKLHFNASLCIQNRDRFVIFLSRKLGDTFRLRGRGWDKAYGLKTAPPFATGEAYTNHFREAAINVNLVNGNAESGLNMRHFEITAAGGFMLCYRQPELASFFEIGKECVVFENEQDLLEKIGYYLDHPDERVEIAMAGQKRTLSQHLFRHRLATILQLPQPAEDAAYEFEPVSAPADTLTHDEDRFACLPAETTDLPTTSS